MLVAFAPVIAAMAPWVAGLALAWLALDDLVTMFRGGDSLIGRGIDAMFGTGSAKAFVEYIKSIPGSLAEVPAAMAEFGHRLWEALAEPINKGIKATREALSSFARSIGLSGIADNLDPKTDGQQGTVGQERRGAVMRANQAAGNFIIQGLATDLDVVMRTNRAAGNQIIEGFQSVASWIGGVIGGSGNDGSIQRVAMDTAQQRGTSLKVVDEGAGRVTIGGIHIHGVNDPEAAGRAAARHIEQLQAHALERTYAARRDVRTAQ